MPFLRRRGVMASESDMRRHTVIDPKPLTDQLPSLPTSSNSDLPTLNSVSEPGPALTAPIPPATPPNDAASSSSSQAATPTAAPADRPASPTIQEETSRHVRFSMLRFRNASDSQLAAKAKQYAAAEKPPPLPRPPEIITTAPTFNLLEPQKKASRIRLSSKFRRSGEELRVEQHPVPPVPGLSKNDRRSSMLPPSTLKKQSVTFDEPQRRISSSNSPPAYGEDNGSILALPANRLSESSRSDGSSGDQRVYASTTTTTHTVHTTTTFFRLPRRRNKRAEPLFPISHLPQQPRISFTAEPSTSNSSLAISTAESSATNGSPSRSGSQRTPTPSRPSSGNRASTVPGHPGAQVTFAKSSASPVTALLRPGSRSSGQSSPTRVQLHLRGRSSTLSSLGRESIDEHLAPPVSRTSSSIGRKSFGDLLSLSRLRQNSEPSGRGGSLTPATPGSNTSKNNSLQIAREPVVLPERREDDTPAKYLARLEDVVSRSVIAAAVSKGSDTFSQAVLRSYMRRFGFFGEPMDMAIRKLLMEAELPKETQHIDRFLQAFANRYHECNPGIYSTPDQAYFIAFSLLILHTDVFNKNNKRKMQKGDYLKNTQDEGIFHEILDVFYDNITYTPFIHVEDDFDINGERIIAHKAKKKSIFPSAAPDPAKKASKEPIDPYTLIIDGNLDVLRPNLKDVMHLEDHYSYLGTAESLNMQELQKTFFKTGILQIVSARSRPDAFMSEKTATNPEEAHPGIVDIKITKVGLLWRKDVKKKKTRSPWQEWGAILTGAQLYFFRNTTWIKSLMHQYENHIKQGHDGIPIIFKPPLEQFKPDALISTDGAVALLDSTYKKHKHAFTYVRHGGFEEVLLADNEEEMNDWLAKLNYAAAFRTSGVRMRGVVGGSYDGQGRRAIRRLDSEAEGIQTPTGEVTVARSKIDHNLVQDILSARREIMKQKIADANEKLGNSEKSLELQLRNSRHLQILAPIHPKTREGMLLSAARFAAQLKWTRMEIWRLKCHRDILAMDLEEERQSLGDAEQEPASASSLGKQPIARDEARGSNGAPQRSPRRSSFRLSFTRDSSVADISDADSPMTEVFQTPPTSATVTSFREYETSLEAPGLLTVDKVDQMKASVPSTVVSNHSTTATPPRRIGTSSSTSERPRTMDQAEDIDANERSLLEQAGLLGADTPRPTRVKSSSGDNGEEGLDRRDRLNNGAGLSDRLERSKIRRSLQRTLREGAGHLSHHRSRKGRDSVSSGATDETARESADVLTRGSGSFVVHGKKASVINFGAELRSMSPDERIRQRSRVLQATTQQRDDAAAQTGNGPSTSDAGSDFRSILTAQAYSDRERHRRESGASASTTTARSFQELHRKYSSAQAAKASAATAAASSAGTLPVPSDTDSEVAVSFSDGRRSPLPPIYGESGSVAEGSVDDSSEDDEDGDEEGDAEKNHRRSARGTQFFTPDPPASPVAEASSSADNRGEVEGQANRKEAERLSSPPLQAISA